MFSHYRLDMACLCCIVFICLCFLCFGLEHDLIWFLIEFRSFRLLICSVSSPYDVVMLLYILIRWVVFVVIFWDEFSTVCQSFIVFIMHEGVIVRNPKTDSNSEFGCPNTAEERERCARGCSAKGQAKGGHVCHTARAPLWPRVAHAGHTWAVWCPSKIWTILPLIFPPQMVSLPSNFS